MGEGRRGGVAHIVSRKKRLQRKQAWLGNGGWDAEIYEDYFDLTMRPFLATSG